MPFSVPFSPPLSPRAPDGSAACQRLARAARQSCVDGWLWGPLCLRPEHVCVSCQRSHERAQPPARAQAAADTCATGLARRTGTRNNLRGYPGRWSTLKGAAGGSNHTSDATRCTRRRAVLASLVCAQSRLLTPSTLREQHASAAKTVPEQGAQNSPNNDNPGNVSLV